MSRPTQGMATDGAHSTKNGLTRFRGVDLTTGEELFLEHIGNQTINIGEFLGVVTAVKYIIAHKYTDTIKVKHWNNNLWGETPADFSEK